MDINLINSLLSALEFSPDNVPLRLHIADTYLRYSRYEEAKNEY